MYQFYFPFSVRTYSYSCILYNFDYINAHTHIYIYIYDIQIYTHVFRVLYTEPWACHVPGIPGWTLKLWSTQVLPDLSHHPTSTSFSLPWLWQLCAEAQPAKAIRAACVSKSRCDSPLLGSTIIALSSTIASARGAIEALQKPNAPRCRNDQTWHHWSFNLFYPVSEVSSNYFLHWT